MTKITSLAGRILLTHTSVFFPIFLRFMAEKGHRRKIWANLAAEISGVGRWARCKQKVSKTGFPRLNRSLYNIHICICPEGRLQRLTSIPADLLYLPKSTPFFIIQHGGTSRYASYYQWHAHTTNSQT